MPSVFGGGVAAAATILGISLGISLSLLSLSSGRTTFLDCPVQDTVALVSPLDTLGKFGHSGFLVPVILLGEATLQVVLLSEAESVALAQKQFVELQEILDFSISKQLRYLSLGWQVLAIDLLLEHRYLG